ncbi:MAG: hypothetical protein RIQ93_779 [Verrucomicrobiota bacterium]|jgi:type 1 glutamine amidotransferase
MSSFSFPISRRVFLRAVLLVSFGLSSLAGSVQAAEALKVVLVAGVKNDAYDNEPSLKKLQQFLEKNYNVKCTWVTPGEDGKSLKGLEALDNADAAVLLVRRMTLPPAQLAQIKRFCDSGKGLVGLRTATHALNEWPTFDVDVFGAKYGVHFGPVKSLQVNQHPVTRRAADFTTKNDMYRYENLASDVTVLMQGTNDKGSMPTAWVRERPNGRVFYVGFGHNEEFDKPAYLRMIGDGLVWTAKKRIADYSR